MPGRASTLLSLARLTHRRDFLRIARAGRKCITSTLILQMDAQPKDSILQPGVRIGFTASGRLGNAVVRNRIKRRLKGAAAELFPLHAQADKDYVVIGRLSALDSPYATLLRDMRYALEKLKVMT